MAACRALNAEGEYVFVEADVSLIRVVDEVCEGIRAKEEAVNVLFLSAGVPSLDRRGTFDFVFGSLREGGCFRVDGGLQKRPSTSSCWRL